MAEDRIDSIVDRPKVAADVDFLKDRVGDVLGLIKQFKGQNIQLFNAKDFKEFLTVSKQLNATSKELRKSVDDLGKAQKAQSAATLQQAKAEKELAAAREKNAKAAKIEQALIEEVNKAKDKTQKATLKELDNMAKLGSAYEQLKQKYKVAANSALEFGAAMGLNSAEFIEARDKAKSYYDQLLALEQSVGRSQRQVGNYTQATFALTQVLREAPAFANSFATGISAISNNIPMLTDEIRRLKEAGLSGGQIFKVFANSLLTFNTILPIGFLLLQAFAPEIKKFVTGLFGGKDALDEITKSADNFNRQIAESKRRVEELTQALEFLRQLSEINLQINMSEDQAAITLLQGDLVSSREYVFKLKEELVKMQEVGRKAFAKAFGLGSPELQNVLATYTEISQVPERILNELSTSDVLLIGPIKAAEQEISTLAETIEKTEKGIVITGAKNQLERKKQAEKAAEEAKKREEDEAKRAEERRRFIFETEKAIIEDRMAANKDVIADEDKDYTVRLGALRNYVTASVELINLEADFEKNKKGVTAEEVAKIEVEKQAKLNQLARDGRAERIKILSGESDKEIEAAKQDQDALEKQELEAFNKRNKNRLDFGKAISAILKKQGEEEKKAADASEALEKKKAEKRKQLAREVADAITVIFTASLEEEKNRIQDQIDLLDSQKQKDIEVANATIINAQDRAAAITAIEARADAQKQVLQQRQRQLDQQKARFERSAAVAKIIADTASAVAEVLPNVPLSLLIGGIGLAQLAKVLSTPIPRYKHGTGDGSHPGGLAVVGDGGISEMVVTPDGEIYRTPAKDTLVDLPAGSAVYPDYNKAMAEAMRAGNYRYNTSGSKPINFTPLTHSFEKVGKNIVTAIKDTQATRRRESLSDRFTNQNKHLKGWLSRNGLEGW